MGNIQQQELQDNPTVIYRHKS